jgi:3-hydroxyacyl-[acyl-carrier-protein] dehydratase
MKLAVIFASLTCAAAFVAPSPNGVTRSTRLYEEAADDAEESAFVGAEAISALTADVTTVFATEDIDKFLPHRYPFALVDKIVSYEPGKKAVGIKCVTKNEEFFNGHFPGKPIMPGVLQLEAMAQLAGCVMAEMEGAEPGAIFFFGGADGVKWKKPVVPGDVLVMEVEVLKFNKRYGICKAAGKAYVDGKIAVEVATMTFAQAK